MSGQPSIALDTIQEVAFFKRDELTTDLICCEVVVRSEGGVVTWFFHEEAPGWGDVLKLVERLPGFQIRIDQLKRARDEPDLLAKLDADLRRTHILLKRLEGVRVWLSKHEVAGKRNSIAAAPGLSLINRYTGSLEFELSHDSVILDTVSRRDIADHMRAIPGEPPTAEELASYDQIMADLYSTDARVVFEADIDSNSDRDESEGEG